MESAEIEYVPKDKQILSPTEQEKMTNFMEALEDLEDVNDYYSNLDI
jgi:transcriptional/translational regulatory protein YebC/TACO1